MEVEGGTHTMDAPHCAVRLITLFVKQEALDASFKTYLI